MKDAKEELANRNKSIYKVKSKLVVLNAKLNSSTQNVKAYQLKIKQSEQELSGLEIQKSGFEEMDKTELTIFSASELSSFNLKSLTNELEKLKSNFQFN